VQGGNLLHLGDGSGPEEISTTPRPGSPIAPTSASNSPRSLIVDGIGDAAMAGMVERIGGAEPNGALLYRLGDEALHLGHFVGGRPSADRGVLAHHGRAHGRMPAKDREIGIGSSAPDRREILGKDWNLG